MLSSLIFIPGRIEFYHFISIVNNYVLVAILSLALCECVFGTILAYRVDRGRHIVFVKCVSVWKCSHSFDLFRSQCVYAVVIIIIAVVVSLCVRFVFANVIRNSKCVCTLESRQLYHFHFIIYMRARIDKVNKNQPSIRAFPHNSPLQSLFLIYDRPNGTNDRTNDVPFYFHHSSHPLSKCMFVCVSALVYECCFCSSKFLFSIISRYVETSWPFFYGIAFSVRNKLNDKSVASVDGRLSINKNLPS